jgi:hypothetical protein
VTIPDLSALVRDAPSEELPALAGQLRAAEVQLELRLRAGPATSGRTPAQSEKWIAPEEAAAVASVPLKRIYEWARGKKWAARPTRRCLRIEEAGFRRWLGTRDC